jgi:hypothetical protein
MDLCPAVGLGSEEGGLACVFHGAGNRVNRTGQKCQKKAQTNAQRSGVSSCRMFLVLTCLWLLGAINCRQINVRGSGVNNQKTLTEGQGMYFERSTMRC